jgi:hypothetical protein
MFWGEFRENKVNLITKGETWELTVVCEFLENKLSDTWKQLQILMLNLYVGHFTGLF